MYPSTQTSHRPFTYLLSCVSCLLCGLSGTLSYAESDYVGSWKLTTPQQGGLHLIIKDDGTAGYFWTDTAETQLHSGVWTADNSGIELLWEDDSRHVFTSDNEGTKIEYYSASQQRLYMVEGHKIAEGTLGVWYQAPRSQQRTADPNKLYESLQGSWNLQGNRILSILNDRVAQLYAEDGQLKQTGRWTRKEKALEIIWDTGNFARLQFEGSQYSYSEIAAAHTIHQASPIAAQVTRNYSHTADALPAGNRPATLSFDSRKAQVKFFQGTWIFKRSANEYERISIGRFGGVRSDRKYQLNGQWKTGVDGLELTWDDGMRGQLLKIGDAFVYLEYAAGRPLDGIPNRILNVAPTLLDRLGDPSEVAYQRAANIIEAASQYPASPTKPKRPAHALNNAPWWWPLWTDPKQEETAEPALIPESEAERPASKKSWIWPF
ncbi:MAG: hypothetical protein ACPGF8_01220 [Opitutales bacterium]